MLLNRIALLGSLVLSVNAHALGLIPTPALKNVQIQAAAVFDPLNGYTYSYKVSNPSANSGEIRIVRIDVTAQSGNGMTGHSFGLMIPLGPNLFSFDFLLSELVSLNSSVSTPGFAQASAFVPFGQNVPPGWNGGIGMGGYASFSTRGSTLGIAPGSSLSGFQLLSFGVPTVRSVHFVPFWMHIVEDHDTVTAADMQAAGQIEQSIIFKAVTLGPRRSPTARSHIGTSCAMISRKQ